VFINGKKLAEEILINLRKKIIKLPHPVGLVAILVGDDPASRLYIGLKKKTCAKTGVEFHDYVLSDECAEKDIIEVIKFLNADPGIHGILVQLPLPLKFDTDKIIAAINPKKDVDGFHPETLKGYIRDKFEYLPPLEMAIWKMIESTKEKIAGKNVLVIANSRVFGQSLMKFLKTKKANPQFCLADDKDLKQKTTRADAIAIAIGKANFLKPEMVKKDCIIIDVGINKSRGKIVGDVDPRTKKKVSFASPVPGGVGPMTIACLLENVVRLAGQKK